MGLAVYAAALVSGYLLGSIPFGFLVAKLKGVDIRSTGSGNIGATNVLRALGKPAGFLVLVLDGLKGYAAAHWVALALAHAFQKDASEREWVMVIAGVAAVLGHNFTCWLRFKGGKGIATSAGVLAALVPWSLLIILAVWIVLTLGTGYVSLGSIAASVTLPFACWLTGESLTLILVTGAMGALAVYKHRSNVQRLIQGTESRLWMRRKESGP